MPEDLHKVSDGFLEFYAGASSGSTYYQVGIELPPHLNVALRPRAVFRAHRRVPHGKNELLEYAQAIEDISRTFSEWAKHIRGIEAAQKDVQQNDFWTCGKCQSVWSKSIEYCQTCGTVHL